MFRFCSRHVGIARLRRSTRHPACQERWLFDVVNKTKQPRSAGAGPCASCAEGAEKMRRLRASHEGYRAFVQGTRDFAEVDEVYAFLRFRLRRPDDGTGARNCQSSIGTTPSKMRVFVAGARQLAWGRVPPEVREIRASTRVGISLGLHTRRRARTRRRQVVREVDLSVHFVHFRLRQGADLVGKQRRISSPSSST